MKKILLLTAITITCLMAVNKSSAQYYNHGRDYRAVRHEREVYYNRPAVRYYQPVRPNVYHGYGYGYGYRYQPVAPRIEYREGRRDFYRDGRRGRY